MPETIRIIDIKKFIWQNKFLTTYYFIWINKFHKNPHIYFLNYWQFMQQIAGQSSWKVRNPPWWVWTKFCCIFILLTADYTFIISQCQSRLGFDGLKSKRGRRRPKEGLFQYGGKKLGSQKNKWMAFFPFLRVYSVQTLFLLLWPKGKAKFPLNLGIYFLGNQSEW